MSQNSLKSLLPFGNGTSKDVATILTKAWGQSSDALATLLNAYKHLTIIKSPSFWSQTKYEELFQQLNVLITRLILYTWLKTLVVTE